MSTTLVERRRAVTPAALRQRAQLGLASHGVQHGSSFMGPASSPFLRFRKSIGTIHIGVPHKGGRSPPVRRPQGQVGTIFRDFARLPQDLGEVPELGKDRVGLDRTIRNTAWKYTRDRQRAHAARCNIGSRRQQLGSSGSHMLQTEHVAENTGLGLDRMWGIDQSWLPPRTAVPKLGPSAPRRQS